VIVGHGQNYKLHMLKRKSKIQFFVFMNENMLNSQIFPAFSIFLNTVTRILVKIRLKVSALNSRTRQFHFFKCLQSLLETLTSVAQLMCNDKITSMMSIQWRNVSWHAMMNTCMCTYTLQNWSQIRVLQSTGSHCQFQQLS
jgi:hypothetical protein